MPIRPELRPLYPPNWPEISRRVRFERAGGKCQGCGRPHLARLRCLSDGRWFDAASGTWRNRQCRMCRWPDLLDAAALHHPRRAGGRPSRSHGWVRRVLKLDAEWNEFYVVNAFVIVLGISCAMVGWRQPVAALLFPAFMLVNGILFHIVPVLITRIFSPGLFTAVILFVPIGTWAYYGAWRDGVLSIGTIIVSAVIGFLLMVFPHRPSKDEEDAILPPRHRAGLTANAAPNSYESRSPPTFVMKCGVMSVNNDLLLQTKTIQDVTWARSLRLIRAKQSGRTERLSLGNIEPCQLPAFLTATLAALRTCYRSIFWIRSERRRSTAIHGLPLPCWTLRWPPYPSSTRIVNGSSPR